MQSLLGILTSLWLLALCVSDLRSRCLPNALTLGGAAAAVFLHAIAGGVAGALDALEGGAICALLVVPFLLKAAGGGDVKMLFAVGCLYGSDHAMGTLYYVSMAGLALALGYRLFVAREKRRELPFGLAIAAGAWLEMLWPL